MANVIPIAIANEYENMLRSQLQPIATARF
jgi:hypothetical protein